MYDSSSEEKWNGYWREKNAFLFERKERSKPIYVIDTPPPFTSGELHMGQAF
ncbi:valyl-tRNA synthetase, partial [mine drainage metagenome]